MSFSCQSCRESRRKCDRAKPTCARCAKYNIRCVYELPPKHKLKMLQAAAGTAAGTAAQGRARKKSCGAGVKRAGGCGAAGYAAQGPGSCSSGSRSPGARPVAEQSVKSRFETSSEFHSHAVKDPFYHYFLLSQAVTGATLMKADPNTSALWFECMMKASHALGVAVTHGSPSGQHALLAEASRDSIIDETVALLPSVLHIRALLRYFYSNVHGPYPVTDVGQLESMFQTILVEKQYYRDVHATITFLADLIVTLRLACLSVFHHYAQTQTVADPNVHWVLQHPIGHRHVKCAAKCVQYLKLNGQLQVQTLIMLRLLLLLDDEENYKTFGFSDAELCRLINDVGVTIKEKNPHMWLIVCWNNLHHMLICGAVNDQFTELVFENDERLFDDGQTLEEIISLDDAGKLRLEVRYILRKGYQLFKLIVNNRIRERTLTEEQFIQFKLMENQQLNLFESTHPSYDFAFDQDQEIELFPQVSINLYLFTDFNKFKWESFFGAKKLANQSLLFLHFERAHSPLYWTNLLFTVSTAIDVAKKFILSLRQLRLIQTPSAFLVSHVVFHVINRTLMTLFGIIVRLLYFDLHSNDQDVLPLVKEALVKLFSIIQKIVECKDLSPYNPRTLEMGRSMIKLFRLGKLTDSMVAYANCTDEELREFYSSSYKETNWADHVNLSPPASLNFHSKVIMNLRPYHAKELIAVLNIYDKSQPLFEPF